MHSSSPPIRNFKAMPTVRKIMANVFWTMTLLECGDAVSAAFYCGTFERLQHRTFIAKGLGCDTASYLCTVMPGPVLPTGLVTGYGINAGR
jgi:hypothetical protein